MKGFLRCECRYLNTMELRLLLWLEKIALR
jgi:hypothetical protein